MTLHENTIHKLQNLPESLLPQVSELIDFLSDLHQANISCDDSQQNKLNEKWQQWFEAVDNLPITTTESVDDYQKQILSRYRKQGLEL